MTSILKQHMPDPYKRVARSVGYALLLGHADAWHGLSVIATARLTLKERAAMSWALLRSLPRDNVVDVASAVLPDQTGTPIPPLFNAMDDASHWAANANSEELEAYCLASFNRMAPHRQRAFLDFVQGRVAA